MLVIHDRVHGIIKRLLPLLYGIYKPFGGIDLLLDEQDGFFLPLVFLTATVILFQHVLISFADAQIRCVLRVQRQIELASAIGDEEIGNELTRVVILSEAKDLIHSKIQRIGIYSSAM